jgi:YD repeat-containing protein
MNTVWRWLEIVMRSSRQRMLGAVQWLCGLWALAVYAIPNVLRSYALLISALIFLSPSSLLLAQAPPPGTATASAANQGSALIWWNFGLVGGGSYSRVQIQHCSVSVSACSDPSASPTIFEGDLALNNCDTPNLCPTSAYDVELTASTTYVEKITLYPSASNTTGQITSVLTAPFTTPAFPTPSISSFQAMSGSSGLLVTNEADQYYLGMNIYGCSGSGCTNFTSLGNGLCCANWSTSLGTLPLSPSTLTVGVAGLTAQTTYTVYVTAFDARNTSAPSPTFTFQTPPPDTTPPTTPAGLAVNGVSASAVTLSYGSSTDDLYLAAYQIQRCTGAGCTNFSPVGETSPSAPSPLTFVDTTVSPSTTYEYGVVAVDASGNLSAPSNVVTVITLPGTPTALTASNATSTQVTLSWTYSGNQAGLAGYLVEQCQGAGCTTFTQVANVPGASALITGLIGLTTYQFRVRSADSEGDDSGYSNVVTVTTSPIAGPTALTASAPSDSQMTLTWTASTAPNVTAYLVERCAGTACSSFVQIGSTPTAPFWDGGLLPVTAYQYRVRAQDVRGGLSAYITTSGTTGTLAAPTGLSGSPASTSQINLSWFASPTAGIARYLIERCSGAGCASFTQIAATVDTTYSDTGLAPNTIYLYRVRATDPGGALSAYAPAVTLQTLVVSPSTNLTASTQSSSQATVAWSASPSGGVADYVVERCNGAGCNGFVPIATVTSTSYVDPTLCASTTYRYRIQAADAAGDMSADSTVVTVTTPANSGGSNSGTACGSSSGGGGGGSGNPVSTYIYDSNGHLLTITTNGVTTTYTYDAVGHVIGIQTGN